MAFTPSQLDEMQQHALTLPGVHSVVQWGGVLVLKIEGKMFATFYDGTLAFKVANDEFLALSGLPGIQPAPYLARAHWIKLSNNNAISIAEIKTRLAASWIIVLGKLPKKTRAAYGL